MITFGPVPSRRLGKSLGINNIPAPKACSYDCIYCQVGRTIRKMTSRTSLINPEEICNGVTSHLNKLKHKDYPDYLTFVANGEPTLDINLGASLTLLRKNGIPLAVITNGSLLKDFRLREELKFSDWVSLKVDAGDPVTWKMINRPEKSLYFKEHVENMLIFASECRGRIYTETMLVNGVNDSPESIELISSLIEKINPVKAYLAIPVRPPSDESVEPAYPEQLNLAWHSFNERNIKTEFLTGFEGAGTGCTGNIYNDILSITAVHPLRDDSLRELLAKDNSDMETVTSLVEQRLIRAVKWNGHKYYLRDYHFNI